MFDIDIDDILSDDINNLSITDIEFIKNNIKTYDKANKTFSYNFREWCKNNNQNINEEESEIYNTLRKKKITAS
ncbi:hypothetical protein BTW14_gp061 [BeAn 58058 virus]|uniref:hypothetical protein n=1 Tax=BeAn 58058 virus TaxID=67082 RepID=UPI00090B74E6|nr:hypothetical protein BTW14_gp061 [BeAn 58058 virus]APG58253.1 hypothetical protein BAV00066 [BeAn 58058 virus]